MDEPILSEAIAKLLARAGRSSAGLQVLSCTAGGNNRVYRVRAGGHTMAAKRYYRHLSDPRDRLHAEYAFLEHARAAGLTCVPGPIARDDELGLGLYEFIEGCRLQPEELAPAHVDQARDFFVRLNKPRARAQGRALPQASEACFTIAEQLQLVHGRIDRLAEIPAGTGIDEEAIAFAAELRARWMALSGQVLFQALTQRIDPHAPLADRDRCISPSDFGFHNAIVSPRGEIFFIDFEYAGWDDPAKAISDFFCHPAVPVPFEYFDGFLEAALKYSDNPIGLSQRTRLLLPVFRIKWCCIVMNDFLPLFGQRRFAGPAIDAVARKQAQLDKARRLLETVH